ncbi:MAG: hypothetical protein K2W95_00950 [Candidatus Obscuribacterales bacterium]|nr:hypothetical protein [Candidatus Obscuribacterales bacterium]
MNGFAGWAIIELMGHVKLAGYVTEEEHFGAKLGRVDIPLETGIVTQFFGGGSVYRVTPVTEIVAKEIARQGAPAPVSSWDLRAITREPGRLIEAKGDFDEDGDDSEEHY